jgi:hypothetical protein
MESAQITTSAAIYFDRAELDAVPLRWLERAQTLFTEQNVSPVLFNAGGGRFESHDGYLLSSGGSAVMLWGATFPACEPHLRDALCEGAVSSIDLDSPRSGARHRDDARIIVSVASIYGMFYVGMDDDLVSSPAVLLGRAYALAESLPPVRYGIAYNMALREQPASYASGHRPTRVPEVIEMIRHRKEWDQRPKTPDKLWTEELMGQKRHLTGLFRGAYPANLVSATHVENAGLRTCGIGALSQVSQSLWLWVLTDQEIPAAQIMLAAAGVLVASPE